MDQGRIIYNTPQYVCMVCKEVIYGSWWSYNIKIISSPLYLSLQVKEVINACDNQVCILNSQ